MTWFRLQEEGAFHPKVVAAGNEAYGAWCRAGQWASAHLTEGVIPLDVALAIGPRRLWKKLEKVRLIEVHEEASPYVMHDFLVYNPTAAFVLSERARKAHNTQDFRSRRKRARVPPVTGDVTAPVNGHVTGAVTGHQPDKNHGPDPDPDPDPGRDPPNPPVGGARGDGHRAPEPESGYDLALRCMLAHWQTRYGEPYVLSPHTGAKSEAAALLRIGKEAQRAGGSDAETVMRHWTTSYFADSDPWLVERRHSFRFLEPRLNKYGTGRVSSNSDKPKKSYDSPVMSKAEIAAQKERSAKRAAARDATFEAVQANAKNGRGKDHA